MTIPNNQDRLRNSCCCLTDILESGRDVKRENAGLGLFLIILLSSLYFCITINQTNAAGK